jgi:hypothetical protein
LELTWDPASTKAGGALLCEQARDEKPGKKDTRCYPIRKSKNRKIGDPDAARRPLTPHRAIPVPFPVRRDSACHFGGQLTYKSRVVALFPRCRVASTML